jgi:hypothetical protein
VRLAVRSGVFPLYEVRNGIDYRINFAPDGTDPEEYYLRQKRFGGKAADLAAMRKAIDNRNARLSALAGLQGSR